MRLIGTYVSACARRIAATLVSFAIAYEHEDFNPVIRLFAERW